MTYQYYAIVERVIDGDTIDVDIDLGFDVHIKERVRLYGIDAPETRTKDKYEKEKGLEAKAFLQELMNDCRGIILLESKEYGKFGRCLGIVFQDIDTEVEERSVNDMMIDAGHATEYLGGKR